MKTINKEKNMKCLVIDDDECKVDNLRRYFTSEDAFYLFKSYNPGMREIVKNGNNYDLLILDMNFPLFDGEELEKETGLLVLSEIKRRRISIPTVVYSSDIIDVSDYDNVIGYIKYDPSLYLKNQVDDISNRCKTLKKI